MAEPKLVIVDDEHDLAGFMRDVAEIAGYQTEMFHRANVFKNDYDGDADAIILDLLLPDIDGVELIRYLAEKDCEAQLILVSGFDDGVLHSAQKLAIEHGLNFLGSLSKPFRQHELLGLLENVPQRSSSITNRESSANITIDEFQTALQDNQLVVYYQPKIHLLSGKVSGFEALVRWQHPDHGLLLPGQFLPMVEKHNLIDDLTWQVLHNVTEQCQNWNRQKLKAPVAINVSAATMRELDLPERMVDLVKKYRLEPQQIMLEMTETTLMEELITSLDILTRLRMKGFRLSIDDFGTGYSSLVQLHRAPFAELKIDQSFVSDMEIDKEAFAIVETVIALAQKLDMQVVAEGVESQSVLDILRGMGCDMAQGYHISHPKPANEITEWLKDNPLKTRR